MKNTTQTSRRGFLTAGFGGLVAATMSGAIPVRAETWGLGDPCLPKEGSYIDGKKVRWIDGSEKYKVLDESNTYNLLVEPIKRKGSHGFEIRTNEVVLDLGSYKIVGDEESIMGYFSGVIVSGDNNEIKNGEISRFYMGANVSGDNSKLNRITVNYNEFGIGLEGGSKHTLNKITAAWNNCDGIHLEPSSESIISDFLVRDNFLGINIYGNKNLLTRGEISGNQKPFSSNSITNVIKDVKFDKDIAPEFYEDKDSITRQTTYQPTILGSDGQPTNEALVTLVRQDGQIALALPTGFDGKINPTPVTTYILQEGLKSDRAPFTVLVDGKIRGSWDGSNGLEQVIQLQ